MPSPRARLASEMCLEESSRPSVGGTCARSHAGGRGAAEDADRQVGLDANLAGEPDVWAQARFAGESLLFQGLHRPELAADDLDLAGRTAGVAAAAVQDINPGILDRRTNFRPASTSNDFSPSTVTVGMARRLLRVGTLIYRANSVMAPRRANKRRRGARSLDGSSR